MSIENGNISYPIDLVREINTFQQLLEKTEQNKHYILLPTILKQLSKCFLVGQIFLHCIALETFLRIS